MPLRLVFMGTPEFAVPTLVELVGGGHSVVAVYTRAPKPAGRGMAPRPSPVAREAERFGLPVFTPKTLKESNAAAAMQAHGADLAVVVAYGLILPKPILEAPKNGCINVHASLLPRWRGAAPIQRAILAGDEISGVTLMMMDEGLDTGPMLHRQTLDIRGKNAGEITEEMANLGARLLVEWLENPTPPEPQPIAGATYAKKIDKAGTRIDWSIPAQDIERQVRAFAPSPGAWFEANGERIKLLAAAVEALPRHPRESGGPDDFENKRDSRFRRNDGLVLDDALLVQCGEDMIRPLKVQRAGRAPMTPGELLRGFPITKGAVLP